MLIPYTLYNASTKVLLRYSNFMKELFVEYSFLFDDLRSQEYFMKRTSGYSVYEDIFNLLNIIVLIEKEIISTAKDKRLTYREYLDKYAGLCIIDRILCEGVEPYNLLIAFDSGYSNFNNISDTDVEELGIGDLKIIEDVPSDNNFVIN